MLKIGSKVRIEQEHHHGLRRMFVNYREGKVEAIYPNFILVRMKEGYLECFKEYELEEME